MLSGIHQMNGASLPPRLQCPGAPPAKSPPDGGHWRHVARAGAIHLCVLPAPGRDTQRRDRAYLKLIV